MLYDAVYWRAGADGPPHEEGLADPEVVKSLAGWGDRPGDTAVVATVDSKQAGAAWYRFWGDDNAIRGYVDPMTPVLVVAVRNGFRRRGVAGSMLDWLLDRASADGIVRISLAVSKDNHALHLYRQRGFLEHTDTGDSLLMVRDITG